MPSTRQRLGAWGEDRAANWYVERGGRIVARNWRVREGELDLVVALEGRLVICEVKTRRTALFGSPFEAVTAQKQARLRRLAVRFLRAHPALGPGALRFDVAAVTPDGVEVLEEAF